MPEHTGHLILTPGHRGAPGARAARRAGSIRPTEDDGRWRWCLPCWHGIAPLDAASIPTNTRGSDPPRRVADSLIDCEEDRTLRAVLVGMLREAR